jgi:hypothetical protein
MSDSVELSTFPQSKYEALAMLYLQNQNLSGLTPGEILDKYDEAYDKIRLRHKEVGSSRRIGWTKL